MENKKRNLKIASIIFLICFLLLELSYVGAEYFNKKVKKQDFDYQTIKCKVVDGYSEYGVDPDEKIYVEYEGKKYTLKSPEDFNDYYKNQDIEAYLYNGKIYSDPDAIVEGSTYGKIESGFIIARAILFFFEIYMVVVLLIILIRKSPKKQNANSGLLKDDSHTFQ